MRTFVFAVIPAILLLSACNADPGQNRYNYNEIGQSVVVEFATVVSAKPVDITGRNTGAGALAGAAVGAGAGSYGGDGSGQAWATAGGALVGAIAGGLAEQAAADQKGIEYVVVTEHKKTKTIVQYQQPEDRTFKVGDRVMVQTRGTYQRVMAADNLPDTIKRPKGIRIVE